MLTDKIKTSPHSSFTVTQLTRSVAICETLAEERLNLNYLTLGEV